MRPLRGMLAGLCLLVALCLGISILPASAEPQMLAASHATARQALVVQSVNLNPATGALTIQGNQDFALNNAKNYSILKLPNPYRLIVEIPDARLGFSGKTLPIRQNGIREVAFSQKKSDFYNAVRLTITVEDAQTLWKLNAANQDSALLIGTMGAPVMNQTLAPEQIASAATAKTANVLDIPPGRNVVEDIYFRDDALQVRARNDSQLTVKNRFTLANPTRLVIDLDNTAVASKDLFKPLHVNSDHARQIRVGQFDEATVRLVIETPKPEQFQIVYPGSDKSLLSLSPNLGASVATLPTDVELTQVRNVFLTRENGESVVRVLANAPLVHRLRKENDKVYVEFLNAAANPGWIHYDEKAHPDLSYLKLEPLAAGQPNAKLVIELKSAETTLDSRLSPDGKTLEVFLSGAAAMANAFTGGSRGAAAPYPARIVIDAGHGGKDLGANREGVNEKDLNLSLALMVKRSLEARGFKVYMTRDSDEFLPLPRITQITNSIRPDLFVSIHHNSSTGTVLNGIETYYYTPQSKPLADRIHRQMVSQVSAPDRGVRKAMFYVIHHTNVPAVLCEVGYVSNPAERRQLQTMERKQRSANAIADGVVDYLKSKVSAQAR